MKSSIKILVIIATFFYGITPTMNAQTLMNKGAMVAQAGVAFGGWSGGAYTSQTPIMSASFSMGIKDDVGPGNLAIGASLGYKRAVNNTWTYNYTFLAPRVTWHPHFIKSDKIDGYLGVGLGVYHLRWADKLDNGNGTNLATTAFAWSAVLGARYYFTEKLGAYAELGAGLGYLNVGIAYKL